MKMSSGFKPSDCFPYVELSILALVNFASAIAITSLFPYIGFMIVDMGLVTNVNKSGYFSGALASSVFAGRLISSYYWGLCADLIGRKPVLSIACFFIAFMSIIFGFSRNFWVALFSRFLLGFMNPIVGISKTLVSEICIKKYESQAMGLTTGSWSLGLIAGPIIGGYLARPAILYPLSFGNNKFFQFFPYLLPNLTVAILAIISLLLVIFKFPETLPKSKQNATITKNNNSISVLLQLPNVTSIISNYFIVSLISTMFDEIYPLWAISSIDNGGLEIDTKIMGNVLSVSGICLVFYTLFLYPQIGRTLGSELSFLYGRIILSIMILTTPCLHYFINTSHLELAMIIHYILLKMSGNLAFASIALLLNQSVDITQRGTINGINMTAGSFAKSIGPFFGTIIFAWSINAHISIYIDYHFIFIIIASIGVFSSFLKLKTSSSDTIHIEDLEDLNSELNPLLIESQKLEILNNNVIDTDNNNKNGNTSAKYSRLYSRT